MTFLDKLNQLMASRGLTAALFRKRAESLTLQSTDGTSLAMKA